MFKAVISDLDGTLLNNSHALSPLTLTTLRTLNRIGVRIILASGRHMIDMRGIRETLGFDCHLIASNGALVADADDRTLFQRTLPSDLAADLLHVDRGDFDVNIYLKDGWYVERENPTELQFLRESGFSYQVTEFSGLDCNAIHKIFFRGEPQALRQVELDHLQQHRDRTSIVWPTEDSLEVMAVGVNKGAAAEAVLSTLGLGLQDAVAFGDGMNDYEMLAMVGRGFVMENAMSELRHRLPQNPHAAHCNDNGVACQLIEIFDL